MHTNVKKLPKSQAEIQITIPAETISEKYESVYLKMAPDVKLQGFRPGKAPRNMIEGAIGEDKIYQEVFNDLMFEAYRNAVKEHDLEPITYPHFHIDEFQKGSDLKAHAVVHLRPAVKIGDYKKIKAKKSVPEVKDEDVKKVLDKAYENWMKSKGGQDAASPIITATTLSQAEAKAETQKQLTKDDFYKEVGATDESTLLSQIRHELEHQAQSRAEMDFENQILDQLEKLTDIDLPDILIEQELGSMMKSLETQLVPLKIKLEDYLKEKNETEEKLKEKWHPIATKRVKLEFALSEVTKNENIDVSEDEIITVINGAGDEKLKKELEKPEQKVYIKYSLQREKTLDRLKELATKE